MSACAYPNCYISEPHGHGVVSGEVLRHLPLQMSEPTIDEMLAWFDKWAPSPQGEAHKAIRAILEQHKGQTKFLNTLDTMHIKAVEQRAMEAVLELERVKAAKLENITIYGYTIEQVTEILSNQDKIKLEAIRAFVERVEKRLSAKEIAGQDMYNRVFVWVVRDELAAMEKENE